MTDSKPVAEHRNIWLTRFYFALFYGGVGFMNPFLNLLYIELGLTGTQVGWITSVAAVITLIAAPFWANRNDKWRNPRGILQLFLMLTALAYLLLSQQVLFQWIAAITIFRAFVGAGTPALSDSLALTVTRRSRNGYGSIRVWGSIGWIIFVPLSGILVQESGNLRISLIGAGVITLLGAMILFPIDARYFAAEKLPDPKSIRFTSVIRRLLQNRPMIGVALMIIFIGMGNNGIMQFENVFLKQLHATESLIGIAGILSALVELPCMLWADRLSKTRGSYQLLLIAMLMTGGLRLFVWAFPAIATIMIARTVSGIAFSFYTIGSIKFIDEQTEQHETRTVLALYTITLTNLISIVSSPIAGAAYDHFGTRWLYVIAAAGYFLAWFSLRLARGNRQLVETVIADSQMGQDEQG